MRFLTEDEFPPYNFAGAGGALEGFNVDIARAICVELKVTCTIQARRFDTIVDALEANEGDAIIAGLAITPATQARLLFSDPYFRTPARFVVPQSAPPGPITPAMLDGKRVAVVANSAHEAYLALLFPKALRIARRNAALAREALQNGEADLLFGDGVSLAFWLNGDASKGCCRFAGGPYRESRYFGNGLAIAMRRNDSMLEKAMSYALFRLWEKGVHADLVRRWFPISPFEPAP